MGTRNRTHRARSAPADVVIAALAERQWGVVARAQLLRAGVTPKEIGGRVRGGGLLKLHRGVYAVGHARLRPRAAATGAATGR